MSGQLSVSLSEPLMPPLAPHHHHGRRTKRPTGSSVRLSRLNTNGTLLRHANTRTYMLAHQGLFLSKKVRSHRV